MTAESYRFFIEKAYNQFFQHECFQISARSKTKAKDIGASGALHTSTKLSGYVWLGNDTNLVHVPEDQVGDVQMDADDEAEEEQMNCQVDRSRFSKMILKQSSKKFKKNLKMKTQKMMKFMKRFLIN